jgi:hypothetical protein
MINKYHRLLFFSFLLFELTGCRSAFQPPPASFERWIKYDASVQQIMASLLECGYPWPGPTAKQWLLAVGVTWEASKIMGQKCMEEQGFSEKYGEGSLSECKYYLSAEIIKYYTTEQIDAIQSACDPETPAPKPSVEKRLNSPYCKTEWASKYPQCQLDFNPDTSSNNRHSEKVTIPSYSATDRITSQVQKDSNTQMNQLLQGTEKKK